MPKSALFLDRDGVINVDRGYVHRADQFEFVPAIFELARFAANELRWPLVVVSNQSGIGRGFFGEDSYQELTRWMCERFAAEGAPIARVYQLSVSSPSTASGLTGSTIPGASSKPGDDPAGSCRPRSRPWRGRCSSETARPTSRPAQRPASGFAFWSARPCARRGRRRTSRLPTLKRQSHSCAYGWPRERRISKRIRPACGATSHSSLLNYSERACSPL